MQVAVIGANGQLGRELCRQLGEQALALALPVCDITEPESIHRALPTTQLDAVINCAAYTHVDQAQSEPERCFNVNVQGVENLVQWCQQANCPLIQISTDYVFGGDTHRSWPYVEADQPSPQGVYAQSKFQGEQHASRLPRHAILRTAGLYGNSPKKNNFVEAMLRLASQRKTIAVVNDQHCSPSFVVHVARAAVYLLKTNQFGIYHVVNSGATTWYNFAREIFAQSGIETNLEPVTGQQFNAPAPRPRYSVLDTSKYRATGGPELPTWQTALREYLASRS